MRQKKVKQRRRTHRCQAMIDRLNQVVSATADTVTGYHRHSLVWGFLVGISSMALGAHHPALAQDWREEPSTSGGGVAADRHPSALLHANTHTRPTTQYRKANSGVGRLVADQGQPGASTQRFDIPEGNLAEALKTYARLVEWQLLYPSDLVAERPTPGLHGTYSNQEALRRLLTGTGIAYHFSDANTVTLYALQGKGEAGVAGVEGTQKAEIPVVKGKTIEVTDTITRPTGFLPPVDGYKADQTTGSTRTALPINETPSSIGVVTRDVIKDTYSLRQNDALEHVSGVSRGRANYTRSESFNIRGFTIGGLDEFSALRSNGLPTFGIFVPDPALIERYEVIKGPVSISGGASSPGGFINRITKTPQAANFATSEFQASSYGLYRGVVDANGVLPSTPNVRGRLLFAVEEGGNFIDDVDVRQYTVAPSLEIDLFDGAGILLLTGHYQRFDGSSYFGFPLLSNGDVPDIPRTRNFGGGSQNGANTTFEERNYELHYNHEFVDNLSLSIKGKYSSTDLIDKGIYGYNFGGGAQLDGTSYLYAGVGDFSYETYAGEIFVKRELEAFGQQHEILVGVDHREQGADSMAGYVYLGSDNLFNPANNFMLPSDDVLGMAVRNRRDLNLRQTGLFGQLVARPFTRLTMVGAVRNDWAKAKARDLINAVTAQETYSELTGRVGAIYELFPGFNVYGGFAQSFNVNFSSMTRDGSLLPPSTGENYEVGAKLELLDGKVLLTTALFRTYRQNIPTRDPLDTRFSIAVGEQRHQGVEFDLNGKPLPGLNLTANVAYLDTEITKDNRPGVEGNIPRQIPRSYVGRVFATYEMQSGPLQGLGFGGGVFFQSGFELQVPNDVETDAYERVDAVVFYRPTKKAYDFTINVRNLLDKTYIETPGVIGAFNQFGAPVSVFGTLRVHFSPDLEWTPPWVD